MTAPAIAADDRSAAVLPQLSTDYLNRYGEALMLIEMVQVDGAILEELRAWRPVDYREHFGTSKLRLASGALSAYSDLSPDQRRAFEDLCQTMNRLITTVTALIGEDGRGADVPSVVQVASVTLRRLISRATQFINANGRVDIAEFQARRLQDEIDAMFAR